MHRSVTTRKVNTESILATNKVLRNTYFLLGLTLLFSALMATVAIASGAAPMGFMGLIVMFGLLFLVQFTAHSAWGIASAFAFTGFMGYSIGPIIGMYMTTFTNGGELVSTALGATGIIFLALSSYTLASKKDFSFMGGFLMIGITVAFLASIAGIFFQMPLLQIVVSGAFAVLSSALIMFHTSQIIHGGERNYITATVSIFVALYNVFIHLLHILAMFAGNRD